MNLLSAYMRKLLLLLLLFSEFFSLFLPTSAWAQGSLAPNFSSPYGFNLGGHFNKDRVDRRRIPPEEFANASRLIAQSGAKWVRVMVFWRNLQPLRRSDWKSAEWSYLTQLMTSLRDQGLLIDLIVGDVPQWANGAPSKAEASGYPPTKMEDWEQFIIKLVQKLGAAGIKIGAWEIENEIDGNSKVGYREHPEKYVEMFARAVPLIRSVPGIHEQGRAFIMPSSFFNVHFAKDDISYWLTHLNKDHIDALSFHTYGPDETRLLRYWNNFLTLRNAAGLRSKPVWLTETNLNEEPNNYLDPEAAVKIPQRIRTFLNSGAQKVFWYCEADGYWGASILKILDFPTRPRLEKHEDVYLAYQKLTGMQVPPLPPEILVGDLNGDGVVNEADRDLFKAQYLVSGGASDFDRSGIVDASDYLILVSNFGRQR